MHIRLSRWLLDSAPPSSAYLSMGEMMASKTEIWINVSGTSHDAEPSLLHFTHHREVVNDPAELTAKYVKPGFKNEASLHF